MSSRALALALCGIVTLASGCATQTIQEGKDLSTTGITYTDAVDSLLDVTTDAVIEFDNKELLKGRVSTNPRAGLEERDAAMLDLLGQITVFRAQTKLLKAYFLSLQALADSTVKDDAGAAVKSLSDSINKVNASLGGEAKLSDDQKTQLGALAGLAASSVQAQKIKRAFSRDAKIIGTNLALQQRQLANITDILRSRYEADNTLFLEERVVKPYADLHGTFDASAWSDARSQWLKRAFVNEQLAAANTAAAQLTSVWADILQGKTDLNALDGLISDVNEFVAAVQTFKAAKSDH